MRNLKKLLAVVVAICVLATMTIPAFAAETKTDAQIVEILGVLKGDGAGVTDTYLAKGTNRMQAAQLYLRLIGLEDEALAETSTDNFDDANLVYAGGQRVLAYLKANPDLGWGGVGANKFEPTGAASAQMIYKVMLEALGYKQGTDFEWADAITFAKDKGLSKIADVTNLTNADMATALVEALNAKVKGSDATLLEKLIDDKIIDEAKAIEAGLIEATPAKLEVVDVKADNLVRVVVTFNQAIDKDSIEDGDFEVADESVKKDDVSLSDDKTVATLKVAKLENGDEVEITIDGIKAVSGVELKDYEGKFTALDKNQPTIKSIEFTGPEVAKVTFSEPISATSSSPDIQIDGGIYSASPITGYDNKNEVEVNLGTELDEGKHTFKIKGFEDFAGYSNLVENITVEYAKVKGAPSVTVKEATQTYVILKFERPVTDFDIDDFYHTYTSWKPLEILNGEGKEFVNENDWTDEIRLVFTNSAKKNPSTASGATDNDRPLPVGKVKIVVKDEAVKDRWDNKIDGDVNLTTEITADLDKPTVTKVTVESEKEIRVYFSEKVVEADAEKEANYKIKNSKGDVISSSKWNVNYNDGDKYAEIKFNEGAVENGKYTITIEAIKDTSLAGNALDTVTFDFEIVDKSAPDKITATWVEADQVVFVKFDDEMDAASVLDEDNYRISNEKPDGLFKEDGDVKLSMFTSKIVKMQFRNLTTDQKNSMVGRFVEVGRVKDAKGNVISSLSLYDEIEKETAPVVEEVKKIADNKFEIKFDQELKSIGANAITVAADGTNTSGASYKFLNKDGKGIVTITVPSSQKSEGTTGLTAGSTYTISIADNAIKSVTGVPVEGDSFTPADFADGFKDGVAPTVAKDTLDKKIVYAHDIGGEADYVNYFIIKYTEDIKAGTVSKYTYEVDGYKVTSVRVVAATSMADAKTKLNNASNDGNYVIIAIEELDKAKNDKDIGATPEVKQVLSIEDLAGNKLEAQDGIEAIAANKTLEAGRD